MYQGYHPGPHAKAVELSVYGTEAFSPEQWGKSPCINIKQENCATESN